MALVKPEKTPLFLPLVLLPSFLLIRVFNFFFPFPHPF